MPVKSTPLPPASSIVGEMGGTVARYLKNLEPINARLDAQVRELDEELLEWVGRQDAAGEWLNYLNLPAFRARPGERAFPTFAAVLAARQGFQLLNQLLYTEAPAHPELDEATFRALKEFRQDYILARYAAETLARKAIGRVNDALARFAPDDAAA